LSAARQVAFVSVSYAHAGRLTSVTREPLAFHLSQVLHMSLTMQLYRHPRIITHRPFGFDIDDTETLWEGCVGSLYRHHLATGDSEVIHLHALANRSICDIVSFRDRLLLVHQDASVCTSYDPVARRSFTHPLPGAHPVVWYALKVAGKVLLFDRSADGAIIIMDDYNRPLRRIRNPLGQEELSSGTLLPDGSVLCTASGPELVLTFFDPQREVFLRRITGPYADASISGRMIHEGVLYLADSIGGRFLRYDLGQDRWLEPLATPGYGQIYGFIGASVQLGSCGYFCLSTYRFRSRLDRATGKLIIPPDASIGVDGHAYRFLDRYLVFDAATQAFEFMVVPPQPDGLPLVCYAKVHQGELVITGYLIPSSNEAPTKLPGDWLVWRSGQAVERPFEPASGRDYQLAPHARERAALNGRQRGTYTSQAPWTPPVSNPDGPSFAYPPGLAQQYLRRLAATDVAKYWRELAPLVAGDTREPGELANKVGDFVRRQIYYNPVQELGPDPMLALESHDGRCGRSVAVALRLCQELGLEARQVDLRHHVVAEVYYDDAWHLLDPLVCGGRPPQRDGQVLSVAEIQAAPYEVDRLPLDCFVYEPELLRTTDGFNLLGYVFGEWGSQPYYSGYYGAAWDYPPTLPHILPARRLDEHHIELRWAPSIKQGGGTVCYRLELFDDRALTQKLGDMILPQAGHVVAPESMRMLYFRVSAMDDHRHHQPQTWYPSRVGNVVLAPRGQYGWYGVL
jgi:hypothetical protein